jgi:putative ABC transport system permease protein
MTRRATQGVAVDWQVAVQPNPTGGGAGRVLGDVQHDPNTRAALPVGFADAPGFQASTGGTTQTTGAGRVLGIPSRYPSTFPGSIRLLTGSLNGPVLAQQTAANLQARPGDTVTVRRTGAPAYHVKIAGVVDLPQADSLFQKVGAPPQSQLVAPPDNVLLLPSATFAGQYQSSYARPDLVSTQIHVRRRHNLPPDPASAYVAETGQARHLEAVTSGAGVVGDNLGTVLGAAREDAAYARILFLFLGLPGAILAGALTAAVAQAGAPRRRNEHALLLARGAASTELFRLVLAEAAMVTLIGGAAGLGGALLLGRIFFGSSTFGSSLTQSLVWAGVAFTAGALITTLSVVVPARRELARAQRDREGARRPRWLAYGLDLLLIAVALGIFWAAGRTQYTLVLAPEGVPTISVSYWAFLAPGLAWIGAGLLSWRICDLILGPGKGFLSRTLAPLSGNLAPTCAAMLSRQRRVVARSAVLVGLALSFAISTATFNSTYHQQAEVDAQLTNGADVTVTESPGTVVDAAYAHRLAHVPGVHAVQPMLHRFAYVGADLQDLYGINPRTITRATSLQNPYFQGAGATQMMHRLASRRDAVLVSAETVNDYQLRLGDMLRLRLQNGRTHAYQSVTFHYVGIVNEFPTAPKDSFIVANAGYVSRATHSPAVGTFLVNTGGHDVPGVAARVQQAVGTSAKVATINDARGLVGSSLTSVDLTALTRLELGFALVIAAAAGALVMGLGLNERRRTVAVATVVGATKQQLRLLSTGEPVFVVVLGVVSGLLGGWGLSYLLVKVLSGVFDPPPSHLAVPWTYIVAVALTAIGAIAAAAGYVMRKTRVNARGYLREM